MALDLSAVGYETPPFHFEYDWKVPALYALGVGAKKSELDYLYEGRGPRVLPTFAVVPAYPALVPLVEKARASMAQVVHGAQIVRVHHPIPPEGRLETIAKLDGIYDLKRLSQVVFTTRTRKQGEDEILFETEWTLIVRDEGGFGGPRPPKWPSPKAAGENPLFENRELITDEQALLYRLSGDDNPLHADPEFAAQVGFEQGPILHGLCTFGFIARAVARGVLGSDPDRIRALGIQFKKPVWPGEELRTVGYRTEEGPIALSAYAGGKTEVVAAGWVEVE